MMAVIQHPQAGFSLVEMLIAIVVVMASLAPAVSALQRAFVSTEVRFTETPRQYRLLAATEVVLAQPFNALLAAAATAGAPSVPTTYSDPAGQADRMLVHLSFYDLANDDNDDNAFTIADQNNDGDNNPYTGDGATIDVVWVRVEIENSVLAVETLTRR